MKLYRIVDDEELSSALNNGVFEANWKYYEKDSGWGKINGKCCMNTFDESQNKNLHFFRYPLDAVQYLWWDRKAVENIYFSSESLCVFDIPDDLVEKGYGFYPNKVSKEYVAKGPIGSNYLLSHTKNICNMIECTIESLEEVIKWYSTVGKSYQMCIDWGTTLDDYTVEGVRTMGGFIYSFKKWFSAVLKNYLTDEEVDKIIDYCYKVNAICYQELDFVKDSNILYDIYLKYCDDEFKTSQELALTFDKLEKKYCPSKINIAQKKPEISLK